MSKRTEDSEFLNRVPDIAPGSVSIEKRPRARATRPISAARQLDLLNAAEEMRLNPASPHNNSLSYMANVLVRLTMPHRQLKDEDGNPAYVYTREHNGLTITMMTTPQIGLPSGTIPRLLMSYITAEACRTKSSVIELGSSMSAFLGRLGYTTRSGGPRGTGTLVRGQLTRLFAANISIIDSREDRMGIANINVAKRSVMWWDKDDADQIGLFKSRVELSKDFFDEIVHRPVPVDIRMLRALAPSPLALDIYCWLTWRFSHLNRPEMEDWADLRMQFGAGYPMTPQGLRDFRTAFRSNLKRVLTLWPEAKVDADHHRGINLRPSPTHVAKRDQLGYTIERISSGKKSERD